jgi:hypothetical protein
MVPSLDLASPMPPVIAPEKALVPEAKFTVKVPAEPVTVPAPVNPATVMLLLVRNVPVAEKVAPESTCSVVLLEIPPDPSNLKVPPVTTVAPV